jgi:hypothetical protein
LGGSHHIESWIDEGGPPLAPSFYKASNELAPGLSGRDGYSTHAIRETDDGVFIRLGTPLARSLAHRETHHAATDEPHGEGRSRRCGGLLGLRRARSRPGGGQPLTDLTPQPKG